MDHFTYRDGELFCEEVSVADIAARAGTPAWVYSLRTLREHYNKLAEAFAPLKPTICFSIKSVANLHILRKLAEEGSGFDVTSGGELYRALQAGGDPAKIVFAGVGKTDVELRMAIDAGIGAFNIESEAEFENLSRLAAEMGKQVRAALRVNPDVYDPRTHTYTTTGNKESKFGVDLDRAERFFQTYGRDENVTLDAVHLHLGSPIYSAQPYVQAIKRALDLISRLDEQGFAVRMIDIGGGYAADYEEGASPPAEEYAREIVPLLKDTGLEVVIEPGRTIACNAGILVAQTLYVKQGGDRKFVIVDAAMTDLIRPALYGGEHFIYPIKPADGRAPTRSMDFQAGDGQKVDIVGGVCESADFLGKDRVLPRMKRGDLLAVFSAGAYGFTMSCNYNTRTRAPEILVDGDRWTIVRRRETYEDLLAPERQAEANA